MPERLPHAAADPATIAVIGTGRVGSALGPQFARLGHPVIYGSRDPGRAEVEALVAKTGAGATAATPAEAVRQAAIVVIATPWSATEQTVRSLELAGKLVVDVTNPFRAGTDGLMEVVVSSSGGELVQSWAPRRPRGQGVQHRRLPPDGQSAILQRTSHRSRGGR